MSSFAIQPINVQNSSDSVNNEALPKASAAQKKEGDKALFLFSNTLAKQEHIDQFKNTLLTEDFASSSNRVDGAQYQVLMNYTDKSTVKLEMNIVTQSLKMNYTPGNTLTNKPNDVIKSTFSGQLGCSLTPEFSEWVTNNLFSANFTEFSWEKDVELNEFRFHIGLDEEKTRPISPTSSFVKPIAPNLELRVGTTVNGIFKPEQKTILFTEGATLKGVQDGVGSFNPKRLAYSMAYSQAENHLPESLKPGFSEWAQNKFQHNLEMESQSFGFTEHMREDGVGINVEIVDGKLTHKIPRVPSIHTLSETWRSPSVGEHSMMTQITFPV